MTSLQCETGNCLNDCSEEKEQNNRERTPGGNGAESKPHFLFAVGVSNKLHMYAVDMAFRDRKAPSSQAGNLTPWRGGFGRRAGAMEMGCIHGSRVTYCPAARGRNCSNPRNAGDIGEGLSRVLYRTPSHHQETLHLHVGRDCPGNNVL